MNFHLLLYLGKILDTGTVVNLIQTAVNNMPIMDGIIEIIRESINTHKLT
jgi:hypothetical protein